MSQLKISLFFVTNTILLNRLMDVSLNEVNHVSCTLVTDRCDNLMSKSSTNYVEFLGFIL